MLKTCTIINEAVLLNIFIETVILFIYFMNRKFKGNAFRHRL